MPIYVHLSVDIYSCRACATAMKKLGLCAESGFDSFREARDASEAVWDSDDGDDFRTVVSTLQKAAQTTADRASDIAEAIAAFADSIHTVQANLNRASTHALEAGLRVGPNPCDAEWIWEPDDLPADSTSTEQQAKHVQQAAAYNDAVDMVDAAREAEANAHATLQRAFEDNEGWLDNLRNSAPWMLGGGILSYLGTAAIQANSWDSVAQSRIAQLERFATIAAEPGSASYTAAATRTASTFLPGVDDAARAASRSGALLPGSFAKTLGNLAAEGLPVGGEIGKKIPIAGVALTGYQTFHEARDAEGASEVATVVVKNAGGFLTGTAATTLLVGSAAGGPAVIAAVGAGMLVSWGVGYMIEKATD